MGSAAVSPEEPAAEMLEAGMTMNPMSTGGAAAEMQRPRGSEKDYVSSEGATAEMQEAQKQPSPPDNSEHSSQISDDCRYPCLHGLRSPPNFSKATSQEASHKPNASPANSNQQSDSGAGDTVADRSSASTTTSPLLHGTLKLLGEDEDGMKREVFACMHTCTHVCANAFYMHVSSVPPPMAIE